MFKYSNNELINFTRRYPNLKPKVLKRDSKIAFRLIKAWDQDGDAKKVLNIFLKEKNNLSTYRYWELLRSVWVICGSVENAELFRRLFWSDKPNKYYFSTPEEVLCLKSLPKNIRVYRASSDSLDGGLSYTLDYEYAKQYAHNFCKNYVFSRVVDKAAIFAFINRNKESELIIL